MHQFSFKTQHLRLTQVVLRDQTDGHNELVQENCWLLHPSEVDLSLQGNLFVVEESLTGSGQVFVKRAPLPHARPTPCRVDCRVKPRKGAGFDLSLLEPEGTSTDSWTILDYQDGIAGRSRVLQEWQRKQRPATPGHTCPRFLSNTWGDRSRDTRIRQEFLESEISAAQRLGVEVVQVDDGWERGVTANSAYAGERGGVWSGFWNADPGFWLPNPERFPRGLEPVVEKARSAGVKLGLWFSPDSWNDFANWRRDADRILELFATFDIEHFKIDGVQATTETATANLRQFFRTVLDRSKGRVVFDLDVTAQVRPGYFGAMEVGPLFVENRYTDWHNYWPHQTLRNLWKLSSWVDPARLRMEFLNNSRNQENYADDPLAPSRYSPDTLFATVMLSNPLGWFEVSNLPQAYFQKVAPLVKIWKEHRQALFAGTIIPVGHEPDGFSWTGFVSLSPGRNEGHLLLFRELSAANTAHLALPGFASGTRESEVLAGKGRASIKDGTVSAEIPEPLGFLFSRFKFKG